ncbi:hypothetical protein BN1708_000331 [Verticillium longisporum]|uniref:Uncharacterized protein n=1 Tax=Verticillium longisporum TaxID=100787 RepID=A0A0G4KCP9_VERLO|nr:hypothetical protein BN1708_000331 [Verticillium longisporum]
MSLAELATPLEPQTNTLACFLHSATISSRSCHMRSCTCLHPSLASASRLYARRTLTAPSLSHCSSSSRYRSSCARERHPKNSSAGASLRPAAIMLARSWAKARKGARPVPAATQTTGVFSASEGRRKAVLGVRMPTWSTSPGARESRYVEATPMYCWPEPEREGALSTEKVMVACSGFHIGEEEMELRAVSA